MAAFYSTVRAQTAAWLQGTGGGIAAEILTFLRWEEV